MHNLLENDVSYKELAETAMHNLLENDVSYKELA